MGSKSVPGTSIPAASVNDKRQQPQKCLRNIKATPVEEMQKNATRRAFMRIAVPSGTGWSIVHTPTGGVESWIATTLGIIMILL